jgi:hypothetical protein
MPTKAQTLWMAKNLNGRGAFDACSFRALNILAAEVVDALAVCLTDQKVFVVITSAIDGWAAHKATCSDLGRELVTANAAHVFTGTADKIKAHVIDGEMVGMGYTQDDVYLRPCCRKA